MRKESNFAKYLLIICCICITPSGFASPAKLKTMDLLYNEISTDEMEFQQIVKMYTDGLLENVFRLRKKYYHQSKPEKVTIDKLYNLNEELVKTAIKMQLLEEWQKQYSEEDLQSILQNLSEDQPTNLSSPLQINLTSLPNYLQRAYKDMDYLNRELIIYPIPLKKVE